MPSALLYLDNLTISFTLNRASSVEFTCNESPAVLSSTYCPDLKSCDQFLLSMLHKELDLRQFDKILMMKLKKWRCTAYKLDPKNS